MSRGTVYFKNQNAYYCHVIELMQMIGVFLLGQNDDEPKIKCCMSKWMDSVFFPDLFISTVFFVCFVFISLRSFVCSIFYCVYCEIILCICSLSKRFLCRRLFFLHSLTCFYQQQNQNHVKNIVMNQMCYVNNKNYWTIRACMPYNCVWVCMWMQSDIHV